MDLVCLGFNHKSCPVELRERMAFSQTGLSEALIAMREIEGLRECFILSTCNRVELYVRGHVGLEDRLYHFLTEFHGLKDCTLRSYFYQFRGREVAHHLFRVACGLDSL